VIFLEVVGVSERLERLRHDNMHAFADLIVQSSRLITGRAVPPAANRAAGLGRGAPSTG